MPYLFPALSKIHMQCCGPYRNGGALVQHLLGHKFNSQFSKGEKKVVSHLELRLR